LGAKRFLWERGDILPLSFFLGPLGDPFGGGPQGILVGKEAPEAAAEGIISKDKFALRV